MSFGNSALAVGLVGVVLVAGPVRRVWAGPQQAATPAAAKVDDGALKSQISATGEAITDSWITAKVKTKFFDETVLKGSDISVETNDHVVTLKGTVASSAARARASAIAEGTEGVTRVVDRLTVRPR